MALPRGAAHAFVDALTSGQRRQLDSDALEEQLAAIVTRAKEKWPGLDVPVSGYLAHVASKLDGATDINHALSRLKTDDLYIAFACARGDAAAVTRLEAKVRDDVHKALAPFRLDAGTRDEVVQRLRERLFVSHGKVARVAGYAGTGPLSGWVCAAAVRLAIDLSKEGKAEVKSDDDEVAEQFEDPSDLELTVIKRKYQKEFRTAFQMAFAELSPEERNLVRFNFIDGLNIEQIGAMQGVHRSTIARRIAKIRQELFEGTRRILKEKFRLTASEVNSLLRLVKSDFDVSIHEALKER
jgi:RNA polymerase sigma-70 factor (ECF subfamily)